MVAPGRLHADDTNATPVTSVKRVSVEEYDKLRGATNTVLLDVRTAAEFEKGRIPHAINIDINSPRFAEQIAALDTNKTYLVHCAVGMRGARACKQMETLGFVKLYDLAPGFDGWKKASKLVEKLESRQDFRAEELTLGDRSASGISQGPFVPGKLSRFATVNTPAPLRFKSIYGARPNALRQTPPAADADTV